MVYVAVCQKAAHKKIYTSNYSYLLINDNHFSNSLSIQLVGDSYIYCSMGVYDRRKFCIWAFSSRYILDFLFHKWALHFIYNYKFAYGCYYGVRRVTITNEARHCRVQADCKLAVFFNHVWNFLYYLWLSYLAKEDIQRRRLSLLFYFPNNI